LNLSVNGKNPNWFYHQIQQYQEHDGTEEFLLQSLIFIKSLEGLSGYLHITVKTFIKRYESFCSFYSFDLLQLIM
jgi:hypothetical protein